MEIWYTLPMEKQFNLDKEQLNTILTKLTDGLLISDSSGNILFCNEAIASYYNLTRTKLLTMKNYDLLEQGLIDHSFTALVLSTKKPITYEQQCKSGEKLLNKTIPIFDQAGKVVYVVEQCYSVAALLFNSGIGPEEEAAAETLQAAGSAVEKAPPLAEFKSPAMEKLYSLADHMAPKNINILILGDSGTGKTQLAKRIHNNSARKYGPFITINCSTIPENLLESELFGYTKGAFSGANSSGKQGLVELANNGTLFLDEIGELPLGIQSKLLQLVQEKVFLPVGGVHPKQVDTRIIAATNRDLASQIAEGVFREDLYYRLAVVTITMPPLAGRKEDIHRLIKHFTNRFNIKHDMEVSFSRETIRRLCDYSYPGNIRELEHLIEFLILNAKEEYVTPYMLPANILHDEAALDPPEKMAEPPSPEDYHQVSTFDSFIEAQERGLIQSLYPQYGNS
ncbi:MAG: sigma 54-interacting transcriptional regulator, partial [Anaerovoracaceae bacterium]